MARSGREKKKRAIRQKNALDNEIHPSNNNYLTEAVFVIACRIVFRMKVSIASANCVKKNYNNEQPLCAAQQTASIQFVRCCRLMHSTAIVRAFLFYFSFWFLYSKFGFS